MIEDFYREESEESLKINYARCNYCGERLRLRARKPKAVKVFLFFLPIKRYKCTNCRRSVYKII